MNFLTKVGIIAASLYLVWEVIRYIYNRWAFQDTFGDTPKKVSPERVNKVLIILSKAAKERDYFRPNSGNPFWIDVKDAAKCAEYFGFDTKKMLDDIGIAAGLS